MNVIEGSFYNHPKFEIVYPDKADVSASDYTAKKLKFSDDINGENKTVSEDNTNGKQQPFYICHPVSLQMKVTTWYGQTLDSWIFDAGKDPIPLKKIFATPAPVTVVDGEATTTEVTEIQVGY